MEDFDSTTLPSHANPIVIQWLKDGKAKIVESGCWEWQRGLTSEGYGQASAQSGTRLAHRLALGVSNTEVCVLHYCDNRSCINPNHLRTGSKSDNQLDMKAKGRGLRASRNNTTCACGLASTGTAGDCHECRSARLGSRPCHCGRPARSKGLCTRHYQQHRKTTKKARQ